MYDKKIREKNLEWLENRYNGSRETVEQLQTEEEYEVCTYETYDHQPGIFIQREEGIVQLNSQYAAVDYASEWADYVIEKQDIKNSSVVVILGFGNGSYVEALVKRLKKKTPVIIYEPSGAVFAKALDVVDIASIAEDENINLNLFVEDINMNLLKTYWLKEVTIESASTIGIVTIPGYADMFADKLNEIIETMSHLNNIVLIDSNTEVHHGKNIVRNQIAIISCLQKVSDLPELMNTLPKDYPAIVVAAGPSLQKNIQELKRAKNKAFIIAVDTAMNLLLKEGIIPDMYVSVDPDKMPELFKHEQVHQIPVCVNDASTSFVFEKQEKATFLAVSAGYVYDLCAAMEKFTVDLQTEGTVAMTAFSLVADAGMNPIVLVGQDLAYTDGVKHAKGTFDKQIKVEDIKEEELLWVEDINGDMVKSSYEWMLFKEGFEHKIKLYLQDRRIIDATEGGAKIEGTEISTLKEVIDKECTREYNFGELILSIKPMFSEAEMKIIREKLNDIPAKLEKMRENSKEALDKYERLLSLSKRAVVDVKEVKKLMKELGRITEKMDNMDEHELVQLYISDAYRKALWDLQKESEEDDLENIAQRGIGIMKAMREMLPEMIELVQNISKKNS